MAKAPAPKKYVPMTEDQILDLAQKRVGERGLQGDEAVAFYDSEVKAIKAYEDARVQGFSDAEASELAWPDGKHPDPAALDPNAQPDGQTDEQEPTPEPEPDSRVKITSFLSDPVKYTYEKDDKPQEVLIVGSRKGTLNLVSPEQFEALKSHPVFKTHLENKHLRIEE